MSPLARACKSGGSGKPRRTPPHKAHQVDGADTSEIDLPLDGLLKPTLKVLTQSNVHVKVHGKEAVLPLIVVDGNETSLVGRNWLENIR